ncbi:methyltransferase domain-containing protein [bacterium]|nr:methyltransferase domain-containing protein [bacterium]
MLDVGSPLYKPGFPRSNRYDESWMMDNHMGPNPVWLMEWLADGMELREGMRVLDLGCGKAASSIFLTKEYGVQVWAGDLWIGPDHNWRRAKEAGVESQVFPQRMEAHALPFAQGFFDAIVSVDAYQYFGTDEMYLGYLSRFLRPAGQLGIVAVGLAREIETVPPALIEPQSNGKVFWEDSCWCFKPPAFWERSWGRSDKVRNLRVDMLEDGWRHWRDFERALETVGKTIFPSDAEAIDRDAGETLAFVRMLAERTDVEAINYYDPTLGALVGVDT